MGTALPLIACFVFGGCIPSSKHNEVQAELTSTQAELQATGMELKTASSELETLRSELLKAQSELKQRKDSEAAFAEARSISDVTERKNAFDQFLISFPSSPLSEYAWEEFNKIEEEQEAERERADFEAALQSIKDKNAKSRETRPLRGKSLEEYHTTLRNKTQEEVIALIGRPTTTNQDGETVETWVYSEGIAYDRITGRSRGIRVIFWKSYFDNRRVTRFEVEQVTW